jgi:hypothetical protein
VQGALRDLEQRLAASKQSKQASRAAIDEIRRELDQAKQVRVAYNPTSWPSDLDLHTISMLSL